MRKSATTMPGTARALDDLDHARGCPRPAKRISLSKKRSRKWRTRTAKRCAGARRWRQSRLHLEGEDRVSSGAKIRWKFSHGWPSWFRRVRALRLRVLLLNQLRKDALEVGKLHEVVSSDGGASARICLSR